MSRLICEHKQSEFSAFRFAASAVRLGMTIVSVHLSESPIGRWAIWVSFDNTYYPSVEAARDAIREDK